MACNRQPYRRKSLERKVTGGPNATGGGAQRVCAAAAALRSGSTTAPSAGLHRNRTRIAKRRVGHSRRGFDLSGPFLVPLFGDDEYVGRKGRT